MTRAAAPAYPFVPRGPAALAPGQFWAVPLSDGRYACCRVLAVRQPGEPQARTTFLAALLDWVGSDRPTAEAIAGCPAIAIGWAHVATIAETDARGILGERPLELDGLPSTAEEHAGPYRVSTHWGPTYPKLRAERRFIAGDPPPAYERREVASPLTDAMLRTPVTGRGVVQFHVRLTDDEFARLGEWLTAYPEMSLRAYGRAAVRDLEFLRFFPSLRRFDVDAAWELESLDGLRHLPPDLEELAVGGTRRRLDLSIVGRFGALKRLFLEGQTKHIEVVSRLEGLEDLTLRSITLPDLSLLLPLSRLRSLDLKLGGTSDLRLLPRVGRLRYLELWRVRGLSDVSMVGRLPELRYLFLQALKHVESLPDLSADSSLGRVHLQAMPGVRDLRPLATAPALEEVVLLQMPHLTPEDLRPLVGLPRLRRVTPALGSLRRSAAARAMLGLPEVTSAFDWRA